MVLEASNNIRISSNDGVVYITGNEISFSTPQPSDQKGIYARFA
jgi:hypothetical protein